MPNELALCKIHHTSLDTNILGIDADLRVHVREDTLREHDGPMPRYGLQRQEYLEVRFGEFRAA